MALDFNSSQAKPYVYQLIHKETGDFYFGSRYANKVPAEDDLGINYFTSSKSVKPRFNEFDTFILGEFDDVSETLQFENNLIRYYWKTPKLLNKSLFTDDKVAYASTKTDEHKRKIGIAHEGKAKPFNLGPLNYNYGKGHLITGTNNPNAKRWEYINIKTGEYTIIDDLVKYCKDNGVAYDTIHGRRRNPGKRAIFWLRLIKSDDN